MGSVSGGQTLGSSHGSGLYLLSYYIWDRRAAFESEYGRTGFGWVRLGQRVAGVVQGASSDWLHGCRECSHV